MDSDEDDEEESQGQFYDVNRDVLCQLPPEAGHPRYKDARLKKRAYGMNDVSSSPLTPTLVEHP